MKEKSGERKIETKDTHFVMATGEKCWWNGGKNVKFWCKRCQKIPENARKCQMPKLAKFETENTHLVSKGKREVWRWWGWGEKCQMLMRKMLHVPLAGSEPEKLWLLWVEYLKSFLTPAPASSWMLHRHDWFNMVDVHQSSSPEFWKAVIDKSQARQQDRKITLRLDKCVTFFSKMRQNCVYSVFLHLTSCAISL